MNNELRSTVFHKDTVMSVRVSVCPSLLRVGLAALAGTLLSACTHLKSEPMSSTPVDYRQRHPITIGLSNQTLDVFTGRVVGGLDRRQTEDVRAFAREYMEKGQGPLIAYLPVNAGPGATGGLEAIRNALGAGGAKGRLQIGHYHADGGVAAPIRLSYARLSAQTPGGCSYENSDLAQTPFSENLLNRPSYNFGCAYQRNLAAQIDDPRDLVRPRQEGPGDSSKRLAGIERIRDAEADNEIKMDGKTIKEKLAK
jgi:pilus assembly protein CpaD